MCLYKFSPSALVVVTEIDVTCIPYTGGCRHSYLMNSTPLGDFTIQSFTNW